MKIGVFGDSFADENVFKDIPGKSWVECLRDDYNYNITSHGKFGTSLYYSYDLFLNLHDLYDKIVFVCTDLGRIHLPHYIEIKENCDWIKHIPNLATAENHLSENRMMNHTLDSIAATKAAVEYFKYLYDPGKEQVLQNLIIKDILARRPDTVMMYLHKAQSHWQHKDMIGLIDISVKELRAHGYENIPMELDQRKCHISDSNNKKLAEKVNGWLNGQEQTLMLDEFTDPPREEIESKVKFKND
jgi:hypothetical protein